MRIVFFGASQLGHRCCREILDLGYPLAGIVSIKEYFDISYAKKGAVRNVTYCDFSDLAQRAKVPLVELDLGITPGLFETLLDWHADLAVVIGWYYMLGDMIRRVFPLGTVGIHASLLPKYRGGAPLVWAMINQERETGVTLFHLSDGVDDGPIVGQRAFPITNVDTIATLLEKTELASLDLLRENLPLLESRAAPRIVQDESQATVMPQRSPDDGEIDWTQPPGAIDAFIRAQTKPYPGAWTVIDGKRVTIWDASLAAVDQEP